MPSNDQPAGPLKVISHTALLYGWPVWLVGFVLGGMTHIEDNRLAIVPPGTTVKSVETDRAFALTVAGGSAPDLEQAAANTTKGQDAFPVRIGRDKNRAVLLAVVILLVLLGSTVPMRGVASVSAVMGVLLLTILFAYQGWWEPVFTFLGGMHLQITAAAYLVPSAVLFVVWLMALLLYDPLRYIIFTPGQFIVHKEIGDMQEAFNAGQIAVEKRPTDYFRHWILGFGSGDLIIKVLGQGVQIELPNVMFVDRRMQQISDLMKVRPVIAV
jgi:hypothetical protein